jgi:hypothetical protein
MHFDITIWTQQTTLEQMGHSMISWCFLIMSIETIFVPAFPLPDHLVNLKRQRRRDHAACPSVECSCEMSRHCIVRQRRHRRRADKQHNKTEKTLSTGEQWNVKIKIMISLVQSSTQSWTISEASISLKAVI